MRQSSLSIFFTEMADRCNETPESSSKKSHMAHARHRERERERESAIGLESDRQCLFLWRNCGPQKNPVPKGSTEEVLFGKKNTAKVAVFCGEKKSDVAIFRE